MSSREIAIFGIGSLRFGPPIVASLASYFGDSNTNIRLWDADAERLDLMHRLAQVCFVIEESQHEMSVPESFEEVVENVDAAIICLEEYCEHAHSKSKSYVLAVSLADQICGLLPESADILWLGEPVEHRRLTTSLDWPAPLSEQEQWTLPHQILRYIHGEEYPLDLLKKFEHSPIKRWLDDPRAEL